MNQSVSCFYTIRWPGLAMVAREILLNSPEHFMEGYSLDI